MAKLEPHIPNQGGTGRRCAGRKFRPVAPRASDLHMRSRQICPLSFPSPTSRTEKKKRKKSAAPARADSPASSPRPPVAAPSRAPPHCRLAASRRAPWGLQGYLERFKILLFASLHRLVPRTGIVVAAPPAPAVSTRRRRRLPPPYFSIKSSTNRKRGFP